MIKPFLIISVLEEDEEVFTTDTISQNDEYDDYGNF